MEKKIDSLRLFIYKKFPFTQKGILHKLFEALITFNFVKYLIIGFSTFFLQIFLLYVIYQIIGVPKEYANILSSLLCLGFNYTFSNSWTFKENARSHKQKLGRYLTLTVFNYSFDVLLAFPFLAVTLGINPYFAKVLITAMIVSWNFFIYKFWVFKTK